MISAQQFQQHFTDVAQSLEARRKRYLGYFTLALLAAVLIELFVILMAEDIVRGGLELIQPLNETADPLAPVPLREVIAAHLLGIVISVSLLLWPVLSYRGNSSRAGLVARGYSLKDDAFSRLCKAFGFEFAPRGGVPLLAIGENSVLPEHELYLSEDLLKGEAHGIRLQGCEASIVRAVDRRRVSLFKGLLLVFDISEIDVKLRKPFSGHTTVISDAQKQLLETIEIYEGMDRFALPGAFEASHEAYTNDPAEAQRIVTAELLEQIATLAQRLQQTAQQHQHWDSKLTHGTNELYEGAKDKLVTGGKLPSEIEQDQRYGTGLDITKGDPLNAGVESLNQQFTLECYGDKCIITVPHAGDLFETDALFSPALNREDAEILYALFTLIDGVSQHLDRVTKNPA